MKLKDIRAEVENLVDDVFSYGPDDIDKYINYTLSHVAGMVNLPTLKGVDVIRTVAGQAWISLSSLTGKFSGKLRKVKTEENTFPQLVPTLELLMEQYPVFDEEGDIEAITLEGYNLWFQKVPSESKLLTVVYYRNPTPLTSDDQEPEDIPDVCQRRLLVNGTAYMIFHEKEDGMEDGKKVNTEANYLIAFGDRNNDSGLNTLRRWIALNRSNAISSLWRY